MTDDPIHAAFQQLARAREQCDTASESDTAHCLFALLTEELCDQLDAHPGEYALEDVPRLVSRMVRIIDHDGCEECRGLPHKMTGLLLSHVRPHTNHKENRHV